MNSAIWNKEQIVLFGREYLDVFFYIDRAAGVEAFL
jgi:hypothetical protein